MATPSPADLQKARDDRWVQDNLPQILSHLQTASPATLKQVAALLGYVEPRA